MLALHKRMMDPNNQNYFSLDEQPSVLPRWWQVRANQGKILAGFGVMVAMGLLGYYGYQMYSLTHVDRLKIDQANTMIARSTATCEAADDPAACAAQARSEVARATGQVAVCDGLNSADFQNCVALIALDNANPDLCHALSGSSESTCADDARLVSAQRSQEYSQCSMILDEEKKAICRAQLLAVVIAAGECEKYGIDQETCQYPGELEAIVAAGDPDGCAGFSSEQRASCEDMFSSLDRDSDGLSRLTEYKLGTSDDTADSDGDGYTDSEEVATGHDPLR